MRILLLGSHLGFNLEYYTKIALERNGCEVKFIGYREFLGLSATPIRIFISRSKHARRLLAPFGLRRFNQAAEHVGFDFKPELVLSIKGEALLPTTIEWFSQTLRAATALWYPDDPRYFGSLARIIAPHYAFVFTASERSVSTYESLGAEHVEHLPFACEPSVHSPITLSPPENKALASEVCFVGTFSRKRAKVIGLLEKAGIKVGVWGPYWAFFGRAKNIHGPVVGPNLAKVFNAAKIVLNIHDTSDQNFKPNMRIFEATGCGSFLLSDKAYGLEKFFTPRKEVVCYDGEDDLIDLVSHYIRSSAERVTIAREGHDRAYQEHTYDHRISKLLKAVS